MTEAIPEQINKDLDAATENGDRVRMGALRNMKSALQKQQALTDDAAVEVLQRLAREGKESVRQHQESGRIDLAEREQGVVDIIESYLRPPPAEPQVDNGPELDAMQNVMARLAHRDDAAAGTDVPPEAAGLAHCPNCDAEYSTQTVRFTCPSCRYPFFNRPLDDNEHPPAPTERILHLFSACEKVANEEWTTAEFQEFISEIFLPQLQEKEKAIREFEIPFGLEQDFALEFEVGVRGVDLCNEAVQRLLAWDGTETDPTETLRGALDLFYRGMNNVKDAMRINRDNRDRPLWI